MFFRLFLLLMIVFTCCADEMTVVFDGKFYRVGNLHAFGDTEWCRSADCFMVSRERDLFLVSVKSPSNCVFDGKNPSNLSVGSKIKLKSDGKNLTGKITAIDKYYLQSDISFNRGDSGKIVSDMSEKPVGLVSHYVVENGRKINFIVRFDNLEKSEFEKIKTAQLLQDWRVFNDLKEYEYRIIQGVKKCSSAEEMRKFLHSQMTLRKEYAGWKSTYLKNETDKSEKIIKDIYERFLK